MYYYIFEPPVGPKEFERSAQIKEYLATLGIAGEMAQPSPGRSVADLVANALAKRYSTIIAIGSVSHTNLVLSSLAESDVVFGMIPLSAHSDPYTTIGVSDWKGAAQALKRRRWTATHLGQLGDHYFLTRASITLPENEVYQVRTTSYQLTGLEGVLEVAPTRTPEETDPVLLFTATPVAPTPNRLQRLFRSTPPPTSPTRLTAPWFELRTTSPQAICVAGERIGTTPCRLTVSPTLHKLIIGPGAKP